MNNVLIQFDTLTTLVALGTVMMELGFFALLALWFFRSKADVLEEYAGYIGRFGLWIGFSLSIMTVVISLYYSEVLGFAPCGLCWLVRIFSYSQLVLFTVALIKGDRGVADYSIALSSLGLLVGLYQHYLQMGGAELVNCPAAGTGADCAERFMFSFGHITFPWVAVVMFAFLIVVMLFVRSKSKS